MMIYNFTTKPPLTLYFIFDCLYIHGAIYFIFVLWNLFITLFLLTSSFYLLFVTLRLRTHYSWVFNEDSFSMSDALNQDGSFKSIMERFKIHRARAKQRSNFRNTKSD